MSSDQQTNTNAEAYREFVCITCRHPTSVIDKFGKRLEIDMALNTLPIAIAATATAAAAVVSMVFKIPLRNCILFAFGGIIAIVFFIGAFFSIINMMERAARRPPEDG